MLALGEVRADRHQCGHPLSETTAPDAEDRYTVGRPFRCHACTAIAAKQKEYAEAQHGQALIWIAERRA